MKPLIHSSCRPRVSLRSARDQLEWPLPAELEKLDELSINDRINVYEASVGCGMLKLKCTEDHRSVWAIQVKSFSPLLPAAVKKGTFLTVKQLRMVARVLKIQLPKKGSGASGGLVKVDYSWALVNHYFREEPASERLFPIVLFPRDSLAYLSRGLTFYMSWEQKDRVSGEHGEEFPSSG